METGRRHAGGVECERVCVCARVSRRLPMGCGRRVLARALPCVTPHREGVLYNCKTPMGCGGTVLGAPHTDEGARVAAGQAGSHQAGERTGGCATHSGQEDACMQCWVARCVQARDLKHTWISIGHRSRTYNLFSIGKVEKHPPMRVPEWPQVGRKMRRPSMYAPGAVRSTGSSVSRSAW